MFQMLRERFAGTFCTVREDIRKPPFDRVELLQGDEVVPGVNVTHFPALGAALSAFRPQFLVNCVGVIKQREEAVSPIPSITINSLLPHKLAQMAARWGGRVIHFSTDCVFSGERGGYLEGDFSDAEDLYGKTKYLGEVTAANALTLRTSIIGRELSEHQPGSPV
jgi:dTDP-4-dehydrorhamnose reductase